MKIISENNIDKNDAKALSMYGRSSLRFMLLLLIITLGIFLAVSIINNNGDNIRFNILGILWCVSVYVYCFFVEPIFYFRSFKKKYS